MPIKRALVIAHEADCPGGQVAVRLAERGYDIHTHVVTEDVGSPNKATPFPAFEDFDVVAIMGSVRSLTNKSEIDTWVYDELELIRAAKAADQPVLGICFGGQLMAEALGGSVELAPVTEIGWHELRSVEGEQNPAGPGPWMEWHHDRFIAPPDATVLAETDNATQLFTIGKMVGTQFHPEIDHEHVARWLAAADDEYLAAYGKDRTEISASLKANEARNNEQCHAFVDWFLDTMVDESSLDESSAAEKTEPDHITTAGLDESSAAEKTEPDHITTAGLDESSAAEKTA